jgi:hypothetical protein
MILFTALGRPSEHQVVQSLTCIVDRFGRSISNPNVNRDGPSSSINIHALLSSDPLKAEEDLEYWFSPSSLVVSEAGCPSPHHQMVGILQQRLSLVGFDLFHKLGHLESLIYRLADKSGSLLLANDSVYPNQRFWG